VKNVMKCTQEEFWVSDTKHSKTKHITALIQYSANWQSSFGLSQTSAILLF